MALTLLVSLFLSFGPSLSRTQGVLEPDGVLEALDGITIIANTPGFDKAQSIVVERVEPEDLPLELPSNENRIAPYYRFSSDTEWPAGYQGLEVHVPLPEGAEADDLALQAFAGRDVLLHELPAGVPGFWMAVPACYDPVAHAAIFTLFELRPQGFYVTFSSGNFSRFC